MTSKNSIIKDDFLSVYKEEDYNVTPISSGALVNPCFIPENMFFTGSATATGEKVVGLKPQFELSNTTNFGATITGMNNAITTNYYRGYTYFNNFIYFVNKNTLCKWDYVSGTNVVLTTGLTTTYGPVGFCEVDNAGTKYLFVVEPGATAYRISTADVVTNVALGFTPRPTPVFLNGRVYLPRESSEDIYNSALDDCTTWPASGFISAEREADNLVGICKVQDVIVAFGYSTIEFFYDAANSTGSPLARNANISFKDISLIYPETLKVINDTVYFLAKQAGSISLWKISLYKLEKLSSDAIEKYFSTFIKRVYDINTSLTSSSNQVDHPVFNYIKYSGKEFIIIKFDHSWSGSYGGTDGWNDVYLYDIEYKKFTIVHYSPYVVNTQNYGPVFLTSSCVTKDDYPITGYTLTQNCTTKLNSCFWQSNNLGSSNGKFISSIELDHTGYFGTTNTYTFSMQKNTNVSYTATVNDTNLNLDERKIKINRLGRVFNFRVIFSFDPTNLTTFIINGIRIKYKEGIR